MTEENDPEGTWLIRKMVRHETINPILDNLYQQFKAEFPKTGTAEEFGAIVGSYAENLHTDLDIDPELSAELIRRSLD